jgi:hypothetical protein
MKRPIVKFKISKEDIGYSAHCAVNSDSIFSDGDTFDELKANVIEAVNLYFEEMGFVYTKEEIQFELELSSFFEFYKVINAKALSERIGMNQSLLSQYINGSKKPSEKQTKRILTGVQQIGRELSEIKFLI